MLKKSSIIAAALLMSFTTLNATEQKIQTSSPVSSTEGERLYSGGFTTGFSLTTLAGAVIDFGYYG